MNKKSAIKCLTFLLLCLTLTGCWGIRYINEQIYIEALGIDYKDGIYTVYTESSNFSMIAKQEGGGQMSSPVVLTGKGKGKSITMAFRQLEKSSQFPLYYGHVQAVIFSDNVIKHKLKEAVEGISRDPLIRYTTWCYGTKENIENILQTTGLFKTPPLYKMMFHPEKIMNRNHTLEPVTLQNVVRDGTEPFGSFIIPSIALTKKHWREDAVQTQLMDIDGGYLTSEYGYKGKLSNKELQGLYWMANRNKTNNLDFPKSDYAVEINSIKHKVTQKRTIGSELRYDVSINATAVLEEGSEKMPFRIKDEQIEKKIKSEVKKTYLIGLKHSADIYNLTRKTYRSTPEIMNKDRLTVKSLGNIRVKVRFGHTGTYKFKHENSKRIF